MRTLVVHQYGYVFSIYTYYTLKQNNNRTIRKCCFVIIVKEKMFSNLRVLYVRRVIRAVHLMHKKIDRKIKINMHVQKSFTCLTLVLKK